MKRKFSIALNFFMLLMWAFSFSGCASTPVHSRGDVAYFAFKGSDPKDTFVIQLTDPARIKEARAILAGQQTDRIHVTGIIIPQKADYNPGWSYHLKPDSIHFFEMAIEVCDANMRYVEEHLDEVGGAFLPGNGWCPWASKLIREIPASEIEHH